MREQSRTAFLYLLVLKKDGKIIVQYSLCEDRIRIIREHNMIKRVLTVFLSVTMVLSVILFVVSCNNSTTETTGTPSSETVVTTKETEKETVETKETTTVTTENDTTETTAEPNGREKMEGFEDVDFGGLTFLICATATDIFKPWRDDYTIWVEDVTGNAVDDAVYERNQVMKNLYNCEIMVDASGSSAYEASIASGDQKYIARTSAYAVLSIASDKYYNVMKFDIDYTQPWWDQNFFEDLTCDGKVFTMCGAFNLVPKKAVWITYYNKDVYESKFSEVNIYQMVRDYEWTFDAMIDFIEKIRFDANGDSNYTFTDGADADIIGYMSTAHNPRYLYYAGGHQFASKNENTYDGYFVSTLSDPKAIDTLEAAARLVKTEGYLTEGYTNCDKAIMNGTTLFVSNVLGQLETYESAEDLRIGILPMPMVTADQHHYYHLPDNHSTFLSVPVAYENMEVIAQFLTLFAYHSYKIVYPAFLNTYKYTYASDEDSGEMVDIIINNVSYDPGYLGALVTQFDSYISTMVNDSSKIGNFTSAATRFTASLDQQIANYRDKISKIDDNY